MTSNEPWTIGRLLKWTTAYFQEHDAESPRLDAEILLAEAQGCSRIELYTTFDHEAEEETRVKFRELVRRRAEGTPVAYLVGRREFYSLEFRVSPAVLIPRPETELLVVALLDLVKARPPSDAPLRIVDVGTGSGILAVCAAKYLDRAEVTAIDKSPQALEIARQNAETHGVAARIQFMEGDLLTSLPADARFDYLVSNPPYVSTAEMADLPQVVKAHEPHLALHAGERGTEVIERLLPQAARHLTGGGGLLVEVSPMIVKAVEQLADAQPELKCQRVIFDHAGHARVVQIERSEKVNTA